ncbi:zinc-binding dehydrogenase [Ammonicoccus fulvus]|uniref:Zinc-binding dehydrogenase n=1 Tax=Ammonicoccus fulvus TaxID=3138240 RepID=A0ABZ3FPY4_9ACTN
MSAWQFTGTNEPLVKADPEIPRPQAGEVVVDVKAAGLCHTDCGVMVDEGWLPLLAKTPITMGHEVAGVISELGEGVTGWSVGDRVGLCPTTAVGAPGFGFDGGFGDKVVLGAEALVAIPDNVTMAEGAAGTDAGMTSHSAVVTAGQVKAGDKVGIIGVGGLGMIGLKVAVLAGAEVYVAELNEDVWPTAKEFGATACAKSISEFKEIGLDTIVDFAGFNTTNEAITTVRRFGRVVQVGMGNLQADISVRDLITNAVTLVGSNGGTPDDVKGVYDFIASGQLKPVIKEITFDEIPQGLEDLHDGKVVGRLVAVRD